MLPIDLKKKIKFVLKATFLNGIKASEVNLKVLSVSPSHQFDNVKRFSPILRDSLEERVSSGVGKVNNNVNKTRSSLERRPFWAHCQCKYKITSPNELYLYRLFFPFLLSPNRITEQLKAKSVESRASVQLCQHSMKGSPTFSFLFYDYLLPLSLFKSPNCKTEQFRPKMIESRASFQLSQHSMKDFYKVIELMLQIRSKLYESKVRLKRIWHSRTPKRSPKGNATENINDCSSELLFTLNADITSKRSFCSNMSSLKLFRDVRHRKKIKQKILNESGNVEPNPGPGPAPSRNLDGAIEVTSYNVRGLNDQSKLRHLVNHCYSKGLSKRKDSIFCFQETFIEKPGLLPFLWRGNFFLTPGRGNGAGCLTLLSSHINIIASRNIEDRAHVLVCQKTDDPKASYIIANVYAPNPNNGEKIEFFENLANVIAEFEITYDCSTIFSVGDFNLIFNAKEAKNRNFNTQEKNVARTVKSLFDDLCLSDAATRINGFTWRRPNSEAFSKIDRIFYSGNQVELSEIDTNWALSMSDYAAIEAIFKRKNLESRRK